MKNDLIHTFNILTWVFCMLSLVTRIYSNTLANILLVAELLCVACVLVLFVVGIINIKKEEKKFKEKVRQIALEFLLTKGENVEMQNSPKNTNLLGENHDIKE